MGAGAFSRTGRSLPAQTLDSIRANRVALKGPIETPVTSGLRSVNLELRKSLDLFANVRPCRLYPGVPSVYEQVDLIVVRENTEGMYTGFEFEMGTVAVKELIRFVEDTTGRRIREDSGISIKSISEGGSRTDRAVRVRGGTAPGTSEGHGQPQGQHHEVLRRAVPGGRAPGCAGTTPTWRSRTASSTLCACS